MKKSRKKKLGRKRDVRNMLARNLATSVVLHEKVTTTSAKAKFIQPILEKKLKIAQKGDLTSRRALLGFFCDKNAVHKIFSEFLPFFKDKKSGFTRIVNLGFRVGDSAHKVQIELIIPEKLKDKRLKKEEEKKQSITKASHSVKTSRDRQDKKEEVKKEPRKPILSFKKKSERVTTKVREKK